MKNKIIRALLDQIKDITDNQMVIGKDDTFSIDEIESHLSTKINYIESAELERVTKHTNESRTKPLFKDLLKLDINGSTFYFSSEKAILDLSDALAKSIRKSLSL